MNRNPGETEGGVGVLLLGIVALCIGAGAALCHCSASTPTPAQQEQVSAMAVELDACVAASPSLAVWQACRAGVLAKYGYDAGPFVLAAVPDAGHDAASPVLIISIVDAGGDR